MEPAPEQYRAQIDALKNRLLAMGWTEIRIGVADHSSDTGAQPNLYLYATKPDGEPVRLWHPLGDQAIKAFAKGTLQPNSSTNEGI